MLILIVFAFLSGIITVMSPCILPILPIMLSGSIGSKMRPYGIITGFIVSFTVITLFLTAIIQSLGIDLDFLRTSAAIILIILGISLLFPKLKYILTSRIPTGNLSMKKTNNGFLGGFFTGLTLGLIWTPCAGPILAAVITVAATSGAGLASLLIILSYSLGTSLIMLIIVFGSRTLISKMSVLNKHLETIQKIFGILIIFTGILLLTGADRTIQTWILDLTPEGWNESLGNFENSEIIKESLKSLKQ